VPAPTSSRIPTAASRLDAPVALAADQCRSLLNDLAQLTDPRKRRGRRHALATMLARADPDALDRVVAQWLANQQPPPARTWRQAVAVDGKTLRLRHEVARGEWLRWRRFDVTSKT
jgi:hypothetical protein